MSLHRGDATTVTLLREPAAAVVGCAADALCALVSFVAQTSRVRSATVSHPSLSSPIAMRTSSIVAIAALAVIALCFVTVEAKSLTENDYQNFVSGHTRSTSSVNGNGGASMRDGPRHRPAPANAPANARTAQPPGDLRRRSLQPSHSSVSDPSSLGSFLFSFCCVPSLCFVVHLFREEVQQEVHPR